MPLFEIETPEGRFEVEAPDEQSAVRALGSPQGSGVASEADLAERITGTGTFADMTGSGIAKAVPFGDEIVSGLNAPFRATREFFQGEGFDIPGAYGRNMALEEELQRRRQERSPVASTVGAVAGGVGAASPLLKGGVSFLQGAQPTLKSLAGRGAAEGAAYGTVYGAGEGQGLQERGYGALRGGVVGALTGGAMGAATRPFVGGGRASRAERNIRRAATDDALTAETAAARLQELGPEATLADLGPNLQRQAGALAATPGRGQEVVRSAVASRQTGAGGRVAGALDDALGQSQDTLALANDIIAQRSAAAKPLYDAAYAKQMPFSRDLESILSRPSMRTALSRAEKLAADEGLRSKQWFAQVVDDGSQRATGVLDASGRGISVPNAKQVNFIRTPDVRELDLTKRALDDMISSAQRAGNNNEARILIHNKNQIVAMIDDAVPEYAQARAAFSGPAAVLDAMEEGQKALSNSLTPNQLRTQLMEMGASEKEAYIQGARAQVANIMGTARNDALAARSTFQRGYNKEKLELLVGKEQAKRLLDSLEAETAFTRTRDVLTGNSETAARSAAMQEIGASPSSTFGVRDAYAAGGTMGALRGGALRGVDAVANALLKGRRQVGNEELARLLMGRDASVFAPQVPQLSGPRKAIVEALIGSGARELPGYISP